MDDDQGLPPARDIDLYDFIAVDQMRDQVFTLIKCYDDLPLETAVGFFLLRHKLDAQNDRDAAHRYFANISRQWQLARDGRGPVITLANPRRLQAEFGLSVAIPCDRDLFGPMSKETAAALRTLALGVSARNAYEHLRIGGKGGVADIDRHSRHVLDYAVHTVNQSVQQTTPVSTVAATAQIVPFRPRQPL